MSVDGVTQEHHRVEAEADHYGDEKAAEEAKGQRYSGSSAGSSGGSSSSVEYDPQFGRLQSRNTLQSRQTEVDLERQKSSVSQGLSRVGTQRLQHSLTVGESLTSRPSKRPLPAFGGGKPYPPPLPNREDYVVEFDGPDDPMYPQNWPFWTKYVISSHYF